MTKVVRWGFPSGVDIEGLMPLPGLLCRRQVAR